MSESKPSTKRRAITIPKHELPKNTEEKEPTLPAEQENHGFNEISVENEPAKEALSEPIQDREYLTTETPQDVAPTMPDEAMSDEEWAQVLEKAKKEKEEQNRKSAPKSEFKDTHVAKESEEIRKEQEEDFIEKEVQRRLALERKKAEGAIKPEKKPEEEKPSEISDEEKKKIAEQNNVSNLVNIALGTDEDFIDAFERELDDDDRPESVRTADPTPYAAGLAVVRQLGQANNQQRLLAKWIGEILERNTNALKGVEKEMRLAKITPKIGDGSGPKKLSGATARAAVVSRMKGMYRVQLYNSGFWLDLRPPTLIDIDSWMQSVDTEFKELGRVLGGHAHAVIDVYIKQKFFDILPSLIQRSNFEEYNDVNKLVNNISYHDYDTLLWAMCCMMYKDGIGAGIYCTNPDCRYVDDHQYIDLRNICFLNTEIFNPAAMEWMTRGAQAGSKLLTESDLLQYREQILNFNKTLKYDNGQTVYMLKVPVIKEFIDESASLISQMERLLNGNHDITTDIVSNQLTYHLYKMLNPWIKTLLLCNEKGDVQYQISDRAAIFDSLDIDQLESTTIYDDITSFIRDTKISYYSSTTLKCPKCGKVADLQHDNMFPLDMQYLFFGLSCHMLERTGASY